MACISSIEQRTTDLEAQAGPPTLPKAPIAAPECRRPHASAFSCLVVMQDLGATCSLHELQLNHNDTGERIWEKIRNEVLGGALIARLDVWVSELFAVYVVGIGTVLQVNPLVLMNLVKPWTIADCSHRKVPTRQSARSHTNPIVHVQGYKQDWMLTEAFRNPTIFPYKLDYPVSYQHFGIGPDHDNTLSSHQSAIVIRKVLDKTKVVWLLALLLFISPGLGAVVGLLVKKAEVGIAVSAAVLALASLVQGLAAWCHS